MPSKNLKLLIRDRANILFDEEVKSITTINDKGKLDILPAHSNFISLVNQTVKVKKLDGTEQEFQIQDAILRNTNNQTEILLGIGVTKKDQPSPKPS